MCRRQWVHYKLFSAPHRRMQKIFLVQKNFKQKFERSGSRPGPRPRAPARASGRGPWPETRAIARALGPDPGPRAGAPGPGPRPRSPGQGPQAIGIARIIAIIIAEAIGIAKLISERYRLGDRHRQNW